MPLKCDEHAPLQTTHWATRELYLCDSYTIEGKHREEQNQTLNVSCSSPVQRRNGH